MDVEDTTLRDYRAAVAAEPIFAAYNANIDAIVRVDDDLEAALPPPDDDLPERVASPRDLSTAVADTMRAGEGNELSLSAAAGDWLAEHVAPDERRLGGQAAIAADVMASVGADPVLYVYLLDEKQRSVFTTPEAIRYPSVEDGRVVYRPVSEVTNADWTKTNWIFEFSEGTTFHGVEATADTRFIAAMRPERFNLDAGDLEPVVDQVGEDVNGAFLAGYHSLRDEYADGTTAVDRVSHAREFVDRLRERDDIPVQVEYGGSHRTHLREAISEEILPAVDVVGIDSRELGVLAEDLGVGVDGDGVVDVYRRASAVREALGADAVKLHATEYFLVAMDGYQPPENVRRGLDFASAVAATKATLGTVANPGALRIGAAEDRSEDGRAAVQRLAEHVGADVVDDGVATTGLAAQPNRVVENPASTVGLGDAVSAASFALTTALSER
ncbi:MAG: ADP-dependent glucokinase/phosphofructokinase [Haloarculaceae archaeon]